MNEASGSECPKQTQTLAGVVRKARGGFEEHATVRAFLRTLSHERPLGQPVRTNGCGEYRITYEHAGAEPVPALVVRVYCGEDVIAESPVVYRPSANDTLDLVVGGATYVGPSAFEQLEQDVRRVCEERPIESLTREQVDTIASMIGRPAASIQALVDASKASRHSEVPASAFYALWHEHVDVTAAAVRPASPAAYRAALTAAAASNTIAPIAGDCLDAIIHALGALAARTQLDRSQAPGSPTVADTLGAAGIPADVQAAFASAYVQNDLRPEAFWAAHANDPVLGGANGAAIQGALQAAALTLNHPPLIRALHDEHGGPPRPAKVAAMTTADWRKLIDSSVGGHPVGAPPSITGANEEERRAAFAETLGRIAADAYPAGRIAAELKTTGAMPDVARYLADHPALDVRRVRAADLTFPELPPHQEKALREGVSKVQRVARVVPDLGHAARLVASGAGSAQAVARMGSAELATVLGEHVPESMIRDVQARARSMTALGVAVKAKLDPIYRGPKTGYIGDPIPQALEALPSLRDIFGSITACACEECQGADGPGAYFVDLLHFIQHFQSSALSTLLSRRPELANLELSCENTNTAMPMIDLVNEALEAAVRGSTTANQTTWRSPDLLANPEHLDPAAYAGLDVVLYPWALPFEMPLEEARVYLAHLGVDRVALMEAFREVQPTDVDVPQEVLRMPAAEWTAIATSPANVAADRWGPGATAATLGNVGELLRRSGLRAKDLPSLLSSPFVNPPSQPPLVLNTNDTCDPELSTIANDSVFDDAAADRIFRFVRLQRRLGWTMAETDRVIHVLGADQITEPLLFAISSFERVRRLLKLSVLELAAFWDDLDTRSVEDAPSQYDALFLDRSVQFIDPSTDPFRLTAGPPREIAGAGDFTKLQANLPRIISALALTRADVDVIVDVTSAPFNLATLSLLFRTATLARALGVSTIDLSRYRALLPIDPFAAAAPMRDRIDRLRALVEAITVLRKGTLSLDEIAYLFLHDTSKPSVARPDSRAVLLDQLTKGLQTIAADATAAATTPNATDVVKRRLPILFADPTELAAAVAILDDAPGAVLTDAATTFAFAPAALPILSAHTPPPPAGADPDEYRLDQIAARYLLVRQPLIDRTSELLRQALVQKKIGDTFGVGVEVAKATLSAPFLAPGTTSTPLQVLASGIPSSAQVDTIVRLHKVALIASRLSLGAAELAWFASPPSGLALDTIPIAPVSTTDVRALVSLYDFVRLRNQQVDGQRSLVSILRLGLAPPPSIFADLAGVMGWDPDEVSAAATLLGIQPSDLTGIGPIARLGAIHSLLTRIGLPLLRVEPWAGALDARTSAEVRDAAKSKHTQPEWLSIARALRDPLRQKQRDALVARLVGNGYSRAGQTYTFKDVDALAQHFLFDVEAGTCEVTSRIKQALGSIQVFIQRCLMNLEGEWLNLGRTAAKQWQWMRAFRVWQANRWIFLYPQNWPDPLLRDDKTPIFDDFEAHLSSGALTDEKAQQALRGYAEALDGVSKLEVVSMFREFDAEPPPAQADPHLLDPTTTIHVLARTPQAPHVWYTRRREHGYAWTPWVKVDREIPTDDATLMVFNRHPWVLWIDGRTGQGAAPTTATAPEPGKSTDIAGPPRVYKFFVSWSQYQNKKWSSAKTSKTSWQIDLPDGLDPKSRDFGTLVLKTSVEAIGDGPDTPPSLRLQVVRCRDLHATTIDAGVFAFTSCNAQPYANREADGFTFDPPLFVIPQGSNTTIDHSGFAGRGALSVPQSTTAPADLQSLMGADFWIMPLAHKDIPLLARGVSDWTLRYPSNDAQIFFPPFTYTDDRRSFLIDRVPKPSIIFRAPLLPSSLPFELARYMAPSRAMVRASNPERLRMELSGLAMDSGDRLGSASAFIEPTFYPADAYRFFNFSHPYACEFVLRLEQYGVDGLLRWDMPDTASADPDPLQLRSVDRFASTYGPNSTWVAKPYPKDEVEFDECGAYSQYNWELFFHAPFMVATRLSQDQQFEAALKWFHYIFDPTTQPTKDDPAPYCYWKVLPFKQQTQIQNITDLLTALASGEDPALSSSCHTSTLTQRIEHWRNNPFNPWLVARERPGAFQWAVVMKYLDTLIAWGDQLFRHDTIESITQATQLYILASQILGPRPDSVPREKAAKVWTWQQLVDGHHLDAFSNELESYLPAPAATANNTGYPFHQAPALAFCIPQNPKLTSYWDTVDDRLFKIRHCMNIQGVVQQLPLFEPKLDPAALIAGLGDAADLSTAVSDSGAAVPRYRFATMLQKANELCGELRALGSSLLAALEKRDAEELARIRATNEKDLLTAVRSVKQSALSEANRTLEGAQSARDAVQTRNSWYASRALVSPQEAMALTLQTVSQILQLVSQGLQAGAGTAAYIPQFWVGTAGAFGSPVMLVSEGGQNVSQGLSGAAQALGSSASALNIYASVVSTLAGYQRRKDEWDMQAQATSSELDQANRQIDAQTIRVQMAETDLDNQDLQISQADQVSAFLRDKYTTQELFDWMAGQTSTIYFQTYQLAYDLAKRAEAALQYELGLDAKPDSSFIKFGYWDNRKQGLLAGERLQADLRRMEAAYLELNHRELEITKHISLALLFPEKLLELRRTGSTIFSLEEWLFDLDLPGHYMRRVKNLSVTVPCVTGPYQSVHTTLTLLEDQRRMKPDVGAALTKTTGAVQSIVTSSAQNDGGLFDPSLRDERYLPFEGAGVISTWKMSLGDRALQSFDWNTITDVVLHVRYTARDGGKDLRDDAIGRLTSAGTMTQGTRFISCRGELSDAWYMFLKGVQQSSATLDFTLPQSSFPFAAQGKTVTITSLAVYPTWTNAVGDAPPTLPIQLAKGGAATSADRASATALEFDNVNAGVDPKTGIGLTFSLPEAAIPAAVAGDVVEGTITRRRVRGDLLRDVYLVMKYATS